MNMNRLIARPSRAGGTRCWIQVNTLTCMKPPSRPITSISTAPCHTAVIRPSGMNSAPMMASNARMVMPRLPNRSRGTMPDTTMPSNVPAPWAPTMMPKAAAPSCGLLLANTGMAMWMGPMMNRAMALQYKKQVRSSLSRQK